MIDYQNISPTIGAVISQRLATLHELDTVYGTEDLYKLLEIGSVDAHNARVVRASQGS